MILCILAFGDKNMRELSLGWVYPSSRCQFHLRMLAEKDSSQFAGDFHSADNFSRGAYSNTGNRLFFRADLQFRAKFQPSRKKLGNPSPFSPSVFLSSTRFVVAINQPRFHECTPDSCEKLEHHVSLH